MSVGNLTPFVMGVNSITPQLLDLNDPAELKQYIERIKTAVGSCVQVNDPEPRMLLYLPMLGQVLFVCQGEICVEELAEYLAQHHYEFAVSLSTELAVEVYGRTDKPMPTPPARRRRGVTP